MSDKDLKSFPPEVVDEVIQMVQAVNAMIAKFKSIRTPIIESSNSVPVATKQLDKVTAETEKATHQMLDLIEGIMEREADTHEKANEVLASLDADETETKMAVEKIIKNADQSQNDSFMLMEAMQFQDITSQQINHANSILEEIEEKLLTLLKLTGDSFQFSEHSSRHFDPDATTEGRNHRQQTVDEIIKMKERAKKGR